MLWHAIFLVRRKTVIYILKIVLLLYKIVVRYRISYLTITFAFPNFISEQIIKTMQNFKQQLENSTIVKLYNREDATSFTKTYEFP